MALWTRTPVVVLLALVFAAPAEATHGSNVFSGNWTTNIGGVGFSVISEPEGAPALQSLGGQPCGAPTVYYYGRYFDANNNGNIVACTRSAVRLTGRYISDGSSRPQGDGAIDLTYSAPNQFSGFYTGEEFFGDQEFTYTGTFQSHANDDGCCPGSETPPSTEEPPPSQQQVNECGTTGSGSANRAQALDELEDDEYCFIITEGPGRGKLMRGKFPKAKRDVRILTGNLAFVDDQGRPVEGPSVAAVEAQAGRASAFCYTLIYNSDFIKLNKPFQFLPDRYATCTVTVSRVLARADQIRKQRAGITSATAAASRCPVKTARRRNRRRVKPKLRVTCSPTANGLRITVRPRSRRRTLRAAFGQRAPRLLVGRSRLSPPGHVRAVIVWTANK
jgi:hypothetical protein